MTTGGVASALKTGLTANTRWYFAQAGVNAAAGPIFGLNGVDTPVKWNGESASAEAWTATTGTVPKEAKFLTYFSSRLWCAKGSRLYFSGITEASADPSNWASENYVDLEPNDGQSITGIGVIGSYLMAFKARKIYQVYDVASAANRKISDSIGCIAPRSIVQTPEGLLFLSEDRGICSTNGVSVTPFSDTVSNVLTEVTASPSTAALASGVSEGSRYYLSISLGGVRNDRVLEYDALTTSWWLHDCASNAFALLDPNGIPTLYSADSTASARISKAFVSGTYTDNGNAYAGKSFYTTVYYAWGNSGSLRYIKYLDPHRVKRVRELRIDGVGNWNAFVATDFTESFAQIDGEIWASSGTSGLSGFFGEATGLFEGTGGGTFMENPTITVDRHYHTPAIGRAISFKYVNEDTFNFKLYSQTISIAIRED